MNSLMVLFLSHRITPQCALGKINVRVLLFSSMLVLFEAYLVVKLYKSVIKFKYFSQTSRSAEDSYLCGQLLKRLQQFSFTAEIQFCAVKHLLWPCQLTQFNFFGLFLQNFYDIFLSHSDLWTIFALFACFLIIVIKSNRKT